MNQHPPERITPLPWRLEYHEYQECWQLYSGEKRLGSVDDWSKQGDIDAQYIVHACNTLPKLEALNAELVEALERVVFGKELLDWERDNMAALIAKAKGGV